MKRSLSAILLGALAVLVMVFGVSCGPRPSPSPSPTPTPTATPTSPARINLVKNGDFESELISDGEVWNAWNSGDAAAPTITRVDGISGFSGYCLNLTSANYGSELHNVQLTKQTSPGYQQIYYDLTAGTQYTFKFKAKASQAATVTVVLQTSDYSWKWNKNFNVITEVTEFSETFTLSESNPLALMFNFGTNPANTEFYLDDIELSYQS